MNAVIPRWDETAQEQAAEAIASQGYAVLPDFLPEMMVVGLRQELLGMQEAGLMRPAGIGRGAAAGLNSAIRGDRICWLEPGFEWGGGYLEVMDGVRQALNRQLFLGLAEYEGHYASYAPGGFYRRHVDRHRDLSARTISSVFYLNPSWSADDGGELLVYAAGSLPGAEPALRQAPCAGTLILFRSADIPHEVLAAHCERHSIAGWFRTRS